MKRAWATWAALAACTVLAAAGLWWLSATTLRLEREQQDARAAAFLDERVRLSLWRMDGLLARLVAQESARNVDAYQPFYVPANAEGATRIASPLLLGPTEQVRLHFVLTEAGGWSSPEAPEGADLSRALRLGLSSAVEANRTKLRDLSTRVKASALWDVKLQPARAEDLAQLEDATKTKSSDLNSAFAQRQSTIEYGKRRQQFASNAAPVKQQAWSPDEEERLAKTQREVDVTAMLPAWAAGELLLLRKVDRGSGQELQGAWLDWPAVREKLLEEIRDLLPHAKLEPVVGGEGEGDFVERRLASLPLKLVPGAVTLPERAPSTVGAVLGAAWLALALALGAMAFLLAGAMSLSERRAAFVSAVTHELRTPLTTFRMYAEMLAEGMVTDEAQRRSYFDTLQKESNRLAHLVENVLAYARLEKKRAPKAVEAMRVADFLAQHARRSEERAKEAGMTLRLESPSPELTVLLEPAAAEQIVFNLVDNACKYARAADDGTITLRAEPRGAQVALVVSDHGPGISKRDAKSLFEPFTKSSEKAAESAPGVGLGLALSRRLARAMGGDLRYEGTASGAAFALHLRRTR